MNRWINRVLGWWIQKRIRQIELFATRHGDLQRATFQNLLQTGRHTEWGNQYGYADIKQLAQYQTRVPVSGYEELFPYIHRMMLGGQKVLWPSPIHWFSKSSGTTNARSKFIPVSKESMQQAHFQGGKDVIGLFFHNCPDTQFYWGKGLSIGGSFQANPDNPESHYGDVSAVIMQNLPRWAQWLRTPPVEVATLEKWEEKIEKMVEITTKQNVTSILGVPTWAIVLIQRILEVTGKKTLMEVWPNLEVFIHGAVSFQPYRSLVDQLVGKPSGLYYQETYNASEGFFAIQDDLSRDDMLLMLDYGIFYEFATLDEIDKPFPKTIPLEEVELMKNYALIISTSGGLWRYKIGDTVKFTSKNPYRIKITGRTKHFINVFGEELIIENAETAISKACGATGAIIDNYTAAPIFMDNTHKGGHEWVVEFKQPPNHLETFVQVLDQTLRQVNSDYDAKRYHDMALQLPVLHSVPPGTFYQWMKQRGKLGGQNKVPRLSNSREYVEDILAQLNPYA